ncbi:MAG: right-handed parallel beta-helix repeat-containing protein [Candidatus Wallbacteria bacterium]|nr:right-handed parallel beta-helix repeat-containing protein [Candidatus Wallbacteria bacterium]
MKAFSFVEILIAIMLLSLAILPISLTFTTGVKQSADTEDQMKMRMMAEELMQEITSKGFDDPYNILSTSLEEAPSINLVTDRTILNDVDDYNFLDDKKNIFNQGLSTMEMAPLGIRGNKLLQYAGFNRKVRIYEADGVTPLSVTSYTNMTNLALNFDARKFIPSRYTKKIFVMGDHEIGVIDLEGTTETAIKVMNLVHTIRGGIFNDIALNPTDRELYAATPDSLEIYYVPEVTNFNEKLQYCKIGEFSSNFFTGSVEVVIPEAGNTGFAFQAAWIRDRGSTNFERSFQPGVISSAFYAPDENLTYFGTDHGLFDQFGNHCAGSVKINSIFKDYLNQRLYVCTEGEGILLRKNGLWKALNSSNGLPKTGNSVNLRGLVQDQASGYLYAATDQGAFFSIDGGLNFESVKLPDGSLLSGELHNIAIFYADRKRYLVLDQPNAMLFRELLLPGTLGDANPFDSQTGSAMCASVVNRFRNFDQTLYACTNNGMFSIVKKPSAWDIKQYTTVSGERRTGLSASEIRDFSIDGTGRWWLGTALGISTSDDGGSTFKSYAPFSHFTRLLQRENHPRCLIAIDEAGREMEIDTFSRLKQFRVSGDFITYPDYVKDLCGNTLDYYLTHYGVAGDAITDGLSVVPAGNCSRIYSDPLRNFLYTLSMENGRLLLYRVNECFFDHFENYSGYREYAIPDQTGSAGSYDIKAVSSALPGGPSVLSVKSDNAFKGKVWIYRRFLFNDDSRTLEVSLNFANRQTFNGSLVNPELRIYTRDVYPIVDFTSSGPPPDFSAPVTADSMSTNLVVLPRSSQTITLAIGFEDYSASDGLNCELDSLRIDFDRPYSGLSDPVKIIPITKPIALSFGNENNVLHILFNDGTYKMGVYREDLNGSAIDLVNLGEASLAGVVDNPVDLKLSANGRRVFILDKRKIFVIELIPLRKNIRVTVENLASQSDFQLSAMVSSWSSNSKKKKLLPTGREEPLQLFTDSASNFFYPYNTYFFYDEIKFNGRMHQIRGPVYFKGLRGKSLSFGGELNCNASCDRPAFFTSYSDKSWGYVFAESDPDDVLPWGGLKMEGNFSLHGAVIKKAAEISSVSQGSIDQTVFLNNQTGLAFRGSGALSVRSSEFNSNQTGLIIDSGNASLDSSLFTSNRTALKAKTPVSLQGITAVSNNTFAELNASIGSIENSLLCGSESCFKADGGEELKLKDNFISTCQTAIQCINGTLSGSFNEFYGNGTAVSYQSPKNSGSSAVPTFIYNYFENNQTNIFQGNSSGHLYAQYCVFNRDLNPENAGITGTPDMLRQALRDIVPLAVSGYLDRSADWQAQTRENLVPTVILDYLLQETGELKIMGRQLLEFYPAVAPGVFTSNGDLKIEGSSTKEVMITSGLDSSEGLLLPEISGRPDNNAFYGIVANGWDDRDLCIWSKLKHGLIEFRGNFDVSQKNFYYNQLTRETGDDLKVKLNCSGIPELSHNFWGKNVPDFNQVLQPKASAAVYTPWAYAGKVPQTEKWPFQNTGATIISTLEILSGMISIDASGQNVIKFAGDFSISGEVTITGNRPVLITSHDDEPDNTPYSPGSDHTPDFIFWGTAGSNRTGSNTAAPFAGIRKLDLPSGINAEIRYGCLNGTSFNRSISNASLCLSHMFLNLNEALNFNSSSTLQIDKTLIKAKGGGSSPNITVDSGSFASRNSFFTSANDNEYVRLAETGLTLTDQQKTILTLGSSPARSDWYGISLTESDTVFNNSAVEYGNWGFLSSHYPSLEFRDCSFYQNGYVAAVLENSSAPSVISGHLFDSNFQGLELRTNDSNKTVQNCTFQKTDWRSLHFKVGCENAVIDSNTFTDTCLQQASDAAGILIRDGSKFTVSNNIFTGDRGTACLLGEGGSLNSVEVTGCTFKDGNLGLSIAGSASDVTVGHQESTGNYSNFFSGNKEAMRISNTLTTVCFNRFSKNQSGIYNSGSPFIHGNLLEENQTGITCSAGKARIMQNTFSRNTTGLDLAGRYLYDYLDDTDDSIRMATLIRGNNFIADETPAAGTAGGNDLNFNYFRDTTFPISFGITSTLKNPGDNYLNMVQSCYLWLHPVVIPAHSYDTAGVDLYPENIIPTMEIDVELYASHYSPAQCATSLVVISYDTQEHQLRSASGELVKPLEFELSTLNGSLYTGKFEAYDISRYPNPKSSLPSLPGLKHGFFKFIWLPFELKQNVDDLDTPLPDKLDLYVDVNNGDTDHGNGFGINSERDVYYDFDGTVEITGVVQGEPKPNQPSEFGHTTYMDAWLESNHLPFTPRSSLSNLEIKTIVERQTSGEKEKIVWSLGDEGVYPKGFNIMIANPDGTEKSCLTSGLGGGRPDISSDGKKIVFCSSGEIFSMDSTGFNQVRLTENLALDNNPSFSPDGTKIVFDSDRDGHLQIYLMNSDGSDQADISGNASNDSEPCFSPVEDRIVFVSDREGSLEIFSMNQDGTEALRLTYDNSKNQFPVFSQDGSKIAFDSDKAQDGLRHIYMMDPNGSNEMQITSSLYQDCNPGFSPDGLKIGFESVRSGGHDLYFTYLSSLEVTKIAPSSQTGSDNDLIWKKVSFRTGTFEITARGRNDIGGDSLDSDKISVYQVEPPALTKINLDLGYSEGEDMLITCQQIASPNKGVLVTFDRHGLNPSTFGYNVVYSHSPKLDDFSHKVTIEIGANPSSTWIKNLQPGLYYLYAQCYRREPQNGVYQSRGNYYEYTGWSNLAKVRVRGWYQAFLPSTLPSLEWNSCSMGKGRVSLLSSKAPDGKYYVLTTNDYGDGPWQILKPVDLNQYSSVVVKDNARFMLVGNAGGRAACQEYTSGLMGSAKLVSDTLTYLDAALDNAGEYISGGERSPSGGILGTMEISDTLEGRAQKLAVWDSRQWQAISGNADSVYFNSADPGTVGNKTASKINYLLAPFNSISASDNSNQLSWLAGKNGKLQYSGDFGRNFATTEITVLPEAITGAHFLEFYLGFICADAARTSTSAWQIANTVDGGVNWTRLSTPLNSQNLDDISMEYDSSKAVRIIRGISSGKSNTILLYWNPFFQKPQAFSAKPENHVLEEASGTFRDLASYADLDGQNICFNWDSVPMATSYRLLHGTGIPGTEVKPLPGFNLYYNNYSSLKNYGFTDVNQSRNFIVSAEHQDLTPVLSPLTNIIKVKIPAFETFNYNQFTNAAVNYCIDWPDLEGATKYHVYYTRDYLHWNGPQFFDPTISIIEAAADVKQVDKYTYPAIDLRYRGNNIASFKVKASFQPEGGSLEILTSTQTSTRFNFKPVNTSYYNHFTYLIEGFDCNSKLLIRKKSWLTHVDTGEAGFPDLYPEIRDITMTGGPATYTYTEETASQVTVSAIPYGLYTFEVHASGPSGISRDRKIFQILANNPPTATIELTEVSGLTDDGGYKRGKITQRVASGDQLKGAAETYSKSNDSESGIPQPIWKYEWYTMTNPPKNLNNPTGTCELPDDADDFRYRLKIWDMCEDRVPAGLNDQTKYTSYQDLDFEMIPPTPTLGPHSPINVYHYSGDHADVTIKGSVKPLPGTGDTIFHFSDADWYTMFLFPRLRTVNHSWDTTVSNPGITTYTCDQVLTFPYHSYSAFLIGHYDRHKHQISLYVERNGKYSDPNPDSELVEINHKPVTGSFSATNITIYWRRESHGHRHNWTETIHHPAQTHNNPVPPGGTHTHPAWDENIPHSRWDWDYYTDYATTKYQTYLPNWNDDDPPTYGVYTKSGNTGNIFASIGTDCITFSCNGYTYSATFNCTAMDPYGYGITNATAVPVKVNAQELTVTYTDYYVNGP